MALRLVIAPIARNDLIEIADYIAKDDPVAARRMIGRIERSLGLALERPFIGALVLRPRRQDLRKLTIAPYIAFYRVQGGELQLVRVLHSSRDIDDSLLPDGPKV